KSEVDQDNKTSSSRVNALVDGAGFACLGLAGVTLGALATAVLTTCGSGTSTISFALTDEVNCSCAGFDIAGVDAGSTAEKDGEDASVSGKTVSDVMLTASTEEWLLILIEEIGTASGGRC